MTIGTGNAGKSREQQREQVALEVDCELSQSHLVGTLRDLSDLGAFFQPEYGILDGEFVSSPQAPDVDPGDAVELRIDSEADCRVLRAEIRWVGFSQTHDCFGFGVQFERAA